MDFLLQHAARCCYVPHCYSTQCLRTPGSHALGCVLLNTLTVMLEKLREILHFPGMSDLFFVSPTREQHGKLVPFGLVCAQFMIPRLELVEWGNLPT